MTAHINVYNYLAWFSAETNHGDRLEFVLHNVEERGNQDYGHYGECLRRMLEAALEPVGKACIQDASSYGNESFLVYAESESELQDALAICEQVVVAWVAKYNVNRMKR